jgi:acyl transferase domain-containing protein/thioesterase domain-containing protein/acyl carrier protein
MSGPEVTVPIAVVGLACRFPGAPDATAFWEMLVAGREGLTRFTEGELVASRVPRRLRQDSSYIPVGGLIDGQDLFDPVPFGLSDAEAALMDPQQRLFLECCWQALEQAGHGGGRGAGSVGVFAGAAQSSYLAGNLADRWDPTGGGSDPVGSLQAAIGTHADYLPLQVAYRLDLTGPAIAVNTTCSTSLVAVHTAVQSLTVEECDTALAGGVSLTVPQGHGYRYVADGIYSADGHVRPFSADGTGIVFTQGVGAVVLRRLDDALADGDPVLAVVHGSAVNNDGADKAGFTAPSLRGQARVIAEALAVAHVDPRQVGHVEAHGTATRLGDPIEVAALRRVFGERGPAWCGLGSVKSNIGHANSAAGIAGFIKTVLALRHRVQPATLHAAPVNELLDLENSPFELVARTRDWQGPQYAGVSAFGIGGTNCHVVLGPAPRRTPPPPDDRPQLLLASGHDGQAAQAAAAALAAAHAAIAGTGPATGRGDQAEVADLAYTSQVGREHLPYRAVAITRDGTARPSAPVRAETVPPRVIFAFPGAGSAYAGMGARLYEQEPVFAGCLDECAELLAPLIGADVRDTLRRDVSDERVRGVAFGLPALFAVSLATARLLRSWGVHPDVMIGHSVGEYTAAVLSGALSLPDATRLVAVRCAEAARAASAGAMLAVPLSEAGVTRLLGHHPELDLAAVNAPDACVLSGPSAAIAALAADRGDTTPVRAGAAMHSRLVEPAMAKLRVAAAGLPRREPALPVVSTVTGAYIEGELSDPEYWVRQLRAPVRFSEALFTAVGGDDARPCVIVEAGPGGVLTTLARRHALPPVRVALACYTDQDADDAAGLRAAVAALWTHGVEVDFPAMHRPGRRRVPAPGYAFQRRRLWVDPPRERAMASAEIDPAEPLQLPVWTELPPADPPTRIGGRWLIYGSDDSLARAICEALTRLGGRPVRIGPGEAGLDEPGPDGAGWAGVIMLPGTPGEDPGAVGAEVLRHAELAGRLAALDHVPALLLHVTRGAERIAGTGRQDPAAAAASVLPRVLAQEQPGLRWRALDLPAEHTDEAARAAVLAELAAALADPEESGTRVAVRDHGRWLRSLQAWQPTEPAAPRPGGTALITGGLGDVGLTLAAHLAGQGMRVVLTSRTEPQDRDVDRQRRIERLREDGAAVEVRTVDAADTEATTALLAELSTTGPVQLVVHAAGVVATAALDPLRDVRAGHVAGHVGAKVGGALALRAAIAALPVEKRPDTVLLMSSAATLVGGIGTGPYAAANAAMDTLATTATDPATRWISVVWDGWKAGLPGAECTVALRHAIDAATGTRALDRLLAACAAGTVPPVVAVSPRDLRVVMAHASAARPAGPAGSVTELSQTERLVADLWSGLFGVSVTSPEADFFALGGHSLLATRMFVALREQTGAELRLRDLLAAPTVGELAALLDAATAQVEMTPHTTRQQRVTTAAMPVPVRSRDPAEPAPAAPRDGTFPMTRVQHAYWVGRDGGYAWGSVPCHFAVEHDCPDLDVLRYEQAWNRVIARHPLLRAIVTRQGRVQLLDHLPAYRIRVHDLTGASEERREQRLAAVRERIFRRPGPADRWPLVQIQAVRLPEGRVRLFIGVDVLICDAASWWIIDRELSAFYADPDALLPEPGVDFGACVVALERRRSGPEGERAAAYWRRRLDSLPGAPALPVREGSGRFVRRSAALGPDTWEALRRAAARRRVTPTAVLLAAYADVLATWTGDRRFCVTLTLFDRPDVHPDVNQVVGDFTSLVLHEVHRGAPEPFIRRAEAAQRTLFEDLDHREFSALDVLAERSSRTGALASVPVVFTSALGIDDVLGGSHDLEWAGRRVAALSQTPQTWLDHQAMTQGGELLLQWDALEPVLPSDEVDRAFADYVARVERLASDPEAWEENLLIPGASAAPEAPAVPEVIAASEFPDIALPIRGGTGERTLFLVHPSGGDVLCYAELSRLLDERIAVVALTDPAMVGGSGVADLGAIARAYADVVRRAQPRGPYLIGGWSMGGSLAHEMTCVLHERGEEVSLLIMVDSCDPTHIAAIDPSDADRAETELILRQLGALEAFLGVDMGTTGPGSRDRLAALPTDTRWAEAERRLREHRLLGKGESARERLGILDRHLRALAAHTPRRLEAATTTLLIRADQRSPRNSGVGIGVDDTPPGLADLGWGAHLAGPLEVAGVDAHHYSVLHRPAVARVAELINDVLSRVT